MIIKKNNEIIEKLTKKNEESIKKNNEILQNLTADYESLSQTTQTILKMIEGLQSS